MVATNIKFTKINCDLKGAEIKKTHRIIDRIFYKNNIYEIKLLLYFEFFRGYERLYRLIRASKII